MIRTEIQIINAHKELEKKEQRLSEFQIETDKLVKKVKESFDEVIKLAKTNDPAFLATFQEAYPEFTHNILKKYPDLTKGEFLLCTMIYLNFSSKQIAEYTQVKHRSIQIRKGRLRKKMNLISEVDLHYYMKTFAK